MKLKLLDIHGFKSFANRTRIEFTEGVTAVVGPNGCGKTNVTESIRWVLGEQNVRTLRGGERMEEVIFNGTAEKKPLGMAAVRLTFADPARRLGFEAEDVTVAREIYRDGESSYYINQTPCRLKDIQDLFMDTGMGSHAYSMIEQHMVEAVLSDKAEERRFLFEEAAGIMKYKLRRKFALRKLESTDQDLQRINDIVGEVERTVNSLSRQVGKARRFQTLSEQLRRVAVTLCRDELTRLAEQEAPLTERLKAATDSLAEASAVEDTQSARQEQLHKEINDRQAAADELGRRLESLTALIRSAEEELALIRGQRISGKEWIASSGENLERLRQNIARRSEELEAQRSQVEQLRSAAADSQGEFDAASKAAREQTELVNNARSAAASAEAQRDELVRSAAGCASRAEALEESATAQKRRAAELLAQAGELGDAVAARQVELARVSTELEALEQERRNCLDEAEERHERLEETRRLSASRAEEIQRQRLSRDSLAGEYRVLERLQKELEGYQEGVRSLLLDKGRETGLEAVAAEVFSTEPKYEKAIEAALGLRIQSIITRDTGTMLNAIERLQSSRSGSATFIARDLVNGYNFAGDRPEQGVLAYCDQVVSCSGEYEFLRRLLLSGVAIVEDLPAALALQKQAKRPLHLVTLSGETLNHYAVSAGAAAKSTSGGTLLMRRRRMEEIKAEGAALSAQITDGEQELEAVETQVEELSAQESESRRRLAGLEERLARLRAERTRLSLECESLQGRVNAASTEASQAESRAAELAAQRDEMSTRAAEARESLSALESEIGACRAEFDNQSALGQEAGRIMQEASLRLAERKARLGELERGLARLESERAEAKAEVERLEQEIEQRRAALINLDERENEVRGGLDESFAARGALLEERDSRSEGLTDLRREMETLEHNLREVRRRREEASETRHSLSLELERIASRRAMTVQQARDGYELDIAALSEDFQFYPSPEEIEKGEPPLSAELAEDLKDKIRKLGPVNVLALEDYEREKERLDFLQTQQKDLVQARNSLLGLIEEINRTARERFMETFLRVQENFQAIFSSLFVGGQAHVRLAEEDNPLESPIEVEARPRGKKMLGLTLLSGGEKALTALALLLAIYSVKPSPFCILDEVDAPLDDANIDRFLSIIRRFSNQTQFIMITHNKRTMEMADCLYGVTMQEPGISKVVSVRLDQIDDEGRIRNTQTEPANA